MEEGSRREWKRRGTNAHTYTNTHHATCTTFILTYQVMMKEPNASTFRFWLARAVESFLRGCSSYADQTFLIRRGLLHHVAGNILSFDARPKEILQSSFDLLGELVKFNVKVRFDTFGSRDWSKSIEYKIHSIHSSTFSSIYSCIDLTTFIH